MYCFQVFYFHLTNKTEEFLLNYEVDIFDIKYYINTNNNLGSLTETRGHIIKEVNKFIKRYLSKMYNPDTMSKYLFVIIIIQFIYAFSSQNKADFLKEFLYQNINNFLHQKLITNLDLSISHVYNLIILYF